VHRDRALRRAPWNGASFAVRAVVGQTRPSPSHARIGGIENSLHSVLDVVLREDDQRARKDHAPDNLAILRRLAFNAGRAVTDPKTSLRGRIKRAGWDNADVLNLVAQMR